MFPGGICIDINSNIIICQEHSVRMINSKGTVKTISGTSKFGFKDGTLKNAMFHDPRGICIDLNGISLLQTVKTTESEDCH